MEAPPKIYSEEEILKLLPQEGVNVMGLPLQYPRIEIDYSGLETKNPEHNNTLRQEIEDMVDIATDYISGPVLADSFATDHDQRRIWEREMGKKYGKLATSLFEKNRFGGNAITGVTMNLPTLAEALDMYGVASPKAESIRALSERLPNVEEYSAFSDEQKLKVVKEISAVCGDLIELLRRKYTEEEVLKLLPSEGVVIVEQPKTARPVDIDYAGFESERENFNKNIHGRLKDAAKACEDYLSGAIITDKFEADHVERRRWRHEMYRKYGDAFALLYGTNKLRLNNVASTKEWIGAVAGLMRIYKMDSTKAKALIELKQRLPDLSQYNEHEKGLEHKLQIVRQLESVCSEFLDIVEKK